MKTKDQWRAVVKDVLASKEARAVLREMTALDRLCERLDTLDRAETAEYNPFTLGAVLNHKHGVERESCLLFHHLCEAIRAEVLHAFYNSYRGRCTRREYVDDFVKHYLDDTLELDYEKFMERRRADNPWVRYPVKQYA